MACGTCGKFVIEHRVYPEDEPADILGRCSAMDGVPLPWAWRWTTREVTGVTAADGEGCATHEDGTPQTILMFP